MKKTIWLLCAVLILSLLTIGTAAENDDWVNPYTDIKKDAFYYDSVRFVCENKLFNGMTATKFEPNSTMTRAMFVTVLGRMTDIDTDCYDYYNSEFSDIYSAQWAIPYINWAHVNGIIEADSNGKFYPHAPLTHAQMYIFLERYASNIEGLDTNTSETDITAIDDIADVPENALLAVKYAAKHSFLILSSNRVTPSASALRAEVAMLLHGFCVNVLDWENHTSNDDDTSNNNIGDINGDTLVNQADLTILNRYFAGWNGYAEQILQYDAADLNDDGVLTRADVMLLARQLEGWND